MPAPELSVVSYIGLLEAIDKHAPARGNNFGNFTAVHIRSKMLAAVQGSAWALPCPPEWYALQRRASRMRDQLAIDLGRQPTTAELSAMLGVTPALLAQVLAVEALHIDGDDSPDWNEPDQVLATEMVKTAMATLSLEQQELVRQRFMQGLTLEAIGEQRGHGHQAVSMSVKRAVAAMQGAVGIAPVAGSHAGTATYCCNWNGCRLGTAHALPRLEPLKRAEWANGAGKKLAISLTNSPVG